MEWTRDVEKFVTVKQPLIKKGDVIKFKQKRNPRFEPMIRFGVVQKVTDVSFFTTGSVTASDDLLEDSSIRRNYEYFFDLWELICILNPVGD